MTSESDRARSLHHRLANTARATSIDLQRLRRQLAFHRLLARVADAGWVLKGGYCLEARLSGQARATKDIDFVRRTTSSGDDLLDELDTLFAESPSMTASRSKRWRPNSCAAWTTQRPRGGSASAAQLTAGASTG
ncbi:MAG: nucleotidyl transferase AbiEii/AbiGii toxin family protein [Austwickia sp.]|jgi:hypothetical protein|nr:MAG: nucleotidyl transferase AbiEii/AbiGii toxin family protein [Austwickia sp.]